MSDTLTVNITEAPQSFTVLLGDAATVELIENHAEETSGVHGLTDFGADLVASEDAEAARALLECLPSDYPVVSGSLYTPELVISDGSGTTTLTSSGGENSFSFPSGLGLLAAVDVDNAWTAGNTYTDSSLWTYSADALAAHLTALGGGNAPTGTGALVRATGSTLTNLTLSNSGVLEFSGRGKLRSGADGLFQFGNNANTGLTRVMFGPSGTAYGAISVTGTGGEGQWRTADGTALAPWTAYSLTANQNVAAGSNITASGSILSQQSVAAGDTFSLLWTNRARLKSQADGEVTIRNNADTANGNLTVGNIIATGAALSSGDNTVLTRAIAPGWLMMDPRIQTFGSPASGTSVGTGSSVTGIWGHWVSLTLGTATTASARASLATNWIHSASSGGTMPFTFPFKIKIPCFLAVQETASPTAFRIYVGSNGSFTLPVAGADAYAANQAGCGLEVRRKASTSGQHEVRIFARNGTASTAGTFSASAWTNLGPNTNSLGKNTVFVLESTGTGTINLYCHSWDSSLSVSPPTFTSTTPLLTLTGTGLNTHLPSAVTNWHAIEAVLVNDGTTGASAFTNLATIKSITVQVGS